MATTTGNNLRIPDDLLAELRTKAEAEGKSAGDLAAEALEGYLHREWLDRLEREGLERRNQYGLKRDEDVVEFVQQVIAERRREHGR